jgi:hypothetical protein
VVTVDSLSRWSGIRFWRLDHLNPFRDQIDMKRGDSGRKKVQSTPVLLTW